MSDSNPYGAPAAVVADSVAVEEFQSVRMLSASGRMGRIRYIGYSVGLMLVAGMLGLALAGVIGVTNAFETEGFPVLGGIGIALIVVLYIAVMVLSVFWGIQRLHDLNLNGWWIVLMFIPFINYIATPIMTLVFWFVPGSREGNRFGAPPVPNTAGPTILAALLPVFAVVGILAAIAIPAYDSYMQRAAMELPGPAPGKN